MCQADQDNANVLEFINFVTLHIKFDKLNKSVNHNLRKQLMTYDMLLTYNIVISFVSGLIN